MTDVVDPEGVLVASGGSPWSLRLLDPRRDYIPGVSTDEIAWSPSGCTDWGRYRGDSSDT
jgi:hypothetical protein